MTRSSTLTGSARNELKAPGMPPLFITTWGATGQIHPTTSATINPVTTGLESEVSSTRQAGARATSSLDIARPRGPAGHPNPRGAAKHKET